MTKRILIFILISSMLLSLIACNNNPPQETDGSPSDTTVNGESESIDGILLSGESRYRIIFPDGKKSFALTVQDKLLALDPASVGKIGYYQTTLDTKLADDGSPEILIGLTNRAESQKAKDALGSYLDYSITVSGNKIAIYANTDKRLEEAVNKFVSLIEKAQNKHVVYKGEKSITNSYTDYIYSSLKLADDNICDFSIVISTSADDTQKGFASNLQAWIATNTGSSPAIITDAEPESKKEIIIGKTSRVPTPEITNEINSLEGDDFYINLANKKLYLSSKTALGYSKLLGAMKNQFAKNNGVFSENADIIKPTSIDGSKVIFIGNSYIYYGNCVIYSNETQEDLGYFYQICKANGEDVTVYDYTFGGKDIQWIYDNHLVNTTEEFRNSIDYVFISESTRNTTDLVERVNRVASIFPNAKEKIFLNHASSAQSGEQAILGMEALKNEGYLIANWGGLVYDVWRGEAKVPNAAYTYKKDTFIVNKEDTHHQNSLSGYITAQMAYCVLTGTSAVGQDYEFCGDGDIHYLFSFETYKQKFYNPNSTNFEEIFNSRPDMLGLQALMDQYIATYN